MDWFIDKLFMAGGFIVLLGVLVFVHELGHFTMAKLFKVKVIRFSLGFPPKMFGFTRGETEYCISWIPLGGYVKMLGEGDETEVPPEEQHRSFANQKPWKRALILVAGPVANLLLPVLIYFGLSIGNHDVGSNILGYVKPHSPAYESGIQPGDEIIAINGEDTPYWSDIFEAITNAPPGEITVKAMRHGNLKTFKVVPTVIQEKDLFGEQQDRKKIGISLNYQLPVIAINDSHSPAAQAGLKTGDQVMDVNGETVQTWYQLKAILQNLSAPFTFTIKRINTGFAEQEAKPQILKIVIEHASALPDGYPQEHWSSAEPKDSYLGLVSANTTISEVENKTPAGKLGLKPGDRILSIDDNPIGFWEIDLASIEALGEERTFSIDYMSGITRNQVSINLNKKTIKDEFEFSHQVTRFGAYNFSGLVKSHVKIKRIGVGQSFTQAWVAVGRDIGLIGKAIGKIFTGSVPLDTMGGPIMLFVIAGKAAKQGLAFFLHNMALISINLGLLNLLPIPVLDGGHLLFLGYEGIRRKPLPLQIRNAATMVGITLLLTLMIFVFKNDILRYLWPNM